MRSSMEPIPTDDDRQVAARWLALAVGVLIPAGLFALSIVVARTPPFSRWVTDPMFFRRCLVVHVDLSLLVWSYAFVGVLFLLLPCRVRSHPLFRHGGHALSLLGVLLLILGAGVPGAEPFLTNYIPTIDHHVFTTGLVLFALGLTVTLLDARLLPRYESPSGWFALPSSARTGIRTAAIAILLALVTFALSTVSTPPGLPRYVHHELVAWGGGHILQVALEAAMLSVWLILLASLLENDPVHRSTAALLFALLLLPVLSAPVLALQGTTTTRYRVGFTFLMQWGIFPVTTVFLLLCLVALWRARRQGLVTRQTLGDVRFLGFVSSAVLTVVGFVLGALIRGSTTLVPAHYHAATGAVTVSFMTLTYLLLESFGVRLPTVRWKRLARWQPVVYALGQVCFAAGFALAGASGMPRKTYGHEQHVRTLTEYVGLGSMGLGGLIAVAGGVLFLTIVITAATTAWRKQRSATVGRSSVWPTTPESIQSRS